MKRKYRVKPGFVFGARKEHGPGAIVELTEREAAGFLDKLELVIVEPRVPRPRKKKAVKDGTDAPGN